MAKRFYPFMITIAALGILSNKARGIEAVYIVSGNLHPTTTLRPYFAGRIPINSVFTYQIPVSPFFSDHKEEQQKISAHFQEHLGDTDNVLLLGWSIGGKFAGPLVNKFSNIKKVILMDPMDGAPPLSKPSLKFPFLTKIPIKRHKASLEVLIIKAEFNTRHPYPWFKCHIAEQGAQLFLHQFAAFEPQFQIVPEAGHNDLLFPPISRLGRLACSPGTSPPARSIQITRRAIHNMLRK